MSSRKNISRLVTLAGLVAAGVLIVVLLTSSAKDPYDVSVTVASATNLLPGQPVRVGGNTVGSIQSITPVGRGLAAKITVGINNPDVYPLPVGTKMDVRWGGTASFYNRYIRLDRGPAGAPKLPNHSTFPTKDFTIPVELDQVLSVFDPPTRAAFKNLINVSGPAVTNAEKPLGEAIEASPPALQQANSLLGTLNGDHAELSALVNSTDSLVGDINRAQPNLQTLLDGTAKTATAIADRASDMEATLQGLPVALTRTAHTLAHGTRTLTAVGSLAQRLGPGVQQLKQIATPLDHVLRTLTSVGPDAIDTLRVVSGGSPELTKLLSLLGKRSPELESIGKQATTQVGCLRPYSPELFGFTQNWGDFLSPTDGQDRYLRAQIENFLPAFENNQEETPAQAMKAFPGLTYAFPNPPGNIAGQPWFQPQCGVTKDALNPNDDQEAKEKGGVV